MIPSFFFLGPRCRSRQLLSLLSSRSSGWSSFFLRSLILITFSLPVTVQRQGGKRQKKEVNDENNDDDCHTTCSEHSLLAPGMTRPPPANSPARRTMTTRDGKR